MDYGIMYRACAMPIEQNKRFIGKSVSSDKKKRRLSGRAAFRF